MSLEAVATGMCYGA